MSSSRAGSCSTLVARRQHSFSRRTCCGCVEQHWRPSNRQVVSPQHVPSLSPRNSRFDMGRELDISYTSSPCFLSLGVTIACRCEAGNRPCASDALTVAVACGSSRSMNSRSKNVGTGSSEHDLVGDVIVMRRTAALVNGWNDDSDDDARVMTGGDAKPEVADRMLSIFFVKKSAEQCDWSRRWRHDDDRAPTTWSATEQRKSGRTAANGPISTRLSCCGRPRIDDV